MSQHHLRSKEARDLGLPDILRMDKKEACNFWLESRYGGLDKVPCPGCGEIGGHFQRYFREQLRCSNLSCRRDFSIFYDSPFANTHLVIELILIALVLFVAAAHGISACELARLMCVDYKTAFLFLGKLREAIMCVTERPLLEGHVQIDGGHFGGKPRKSCRRRKPTASAVGARARQKFGRKSGKSHPQMPQSINDQLNALKRMNRRVAIVLRECNGESGEGAGRSVVAICRTENAADVKELVCRFVKPGSTLFSDENAAYDWLSLPGSGYGHRRVNHSIELCTIDGVNENQAESAFSRMRRAEYGTTHRVTPHYFADYAWEYIWRENVRKLSARQKVVELIRLVGQAGLSRWWRHYYQGNRRQKEILLDHLPSRTKFSHLNQRDGRP